jgi:hypothetical protein
VAAARVIYRAIGDSVRERGELAWQNRIIVHKSRKILGVAEGMLDATRATFVDRHTPAAPRDGNLWSAPPVH